ncbi:MAG: hypothetical protein Q4P71_06480 [Actinomycetaceae bacterium]|nr:hypothetical protein [Actinomycetaceae bacterium]
MRLLTDSDIWSVYSMSQALDDVANAFVATSANEVDLPLRTRISINDRRTLLMMPSYSSKVNAAAVKTIGLYPDNAKHNLPTAPATTILIDTETGQVRALLDGDTVTKIRTGASSGVAFRYLARPDSRIGVVVGTGGQAYTQLLAMVTALPSLEDVRIVNRNRGRAAAFVDKIQSWQPFIDSGYSGTVSIETDSDTAADGADVIILVTSSHEPVVSAQNLKPGCTISCVGSYQPHMQECGSDIVERADRIVCDQVEACLEESGDLIIPLKKGLIDESKISDEIGEIIAGKKPGRSSDDEIILYETVGVGTQDLWAAARIAEAAEKRGVGAEWRITPLS